MDLRLVAVFGEERLLEDRDGALLRHKDSIHSEREARFDQNAPHVRREFIAAFRSTFDDGPELGAHVAPPAGLFLTPFPVENDRASGRFDASFTAESQHDFFTEIEPSCLCGVVLLQRRRKYGVGVGQVGEANGIVVFAGQCIAAAQFGSLQSDRASSGTGVHHVLVEFGAEDAETAAFDETFGNLAQTSFVSFKPSGHEDLL